MFRTKYNPSFNDDNWRNLLFSEKSNWLMQPLLELGAFHTKERCFERGEYVNSVISCKSPRMEARSEAITFFFLAFLSQNASYAIE